jgi:iron complex outermembrane receptor protein
MNSGKIRIFSRLAIGTALCTFGAGHAFAATPAETPAPVATVSSADIVVTAQRRAEKLVDVPMSITAVNQSQLTKAGVTTFSDIESVAVGVKIGLTGIFPEPSIRGITSFLTAGGADANVAVYVDGFYQPDPLLFAQDIVNLQDLQVLKGPQGTLYGRNASGGAILIRTLDPDMNKFTGKLSAGYGNFNDARGSGYVSVPLAPGLAISFDGSYRQNDGYIKGIIIGKHNNHYFNVSPYKANQFETKVKWQPTDNLTFTAGYHYTYLNDPFNNNYNIFALQGPVLGATPLQTNRRDHVVRNVATLYKTRSDTAHARAEWKTDIGTLSFQTQYQRTLSHTYQDDDDTGLDWSRNMAIFGQRSWDHTLEFQTNGIDRFHLVAGINRFIEHATGDGASYLGTAQTHALAPTIFSAKSFLNTRAMAYYIDGTYDVTDQLHLNAGVRYTTEKKSTTGFLFSGIDKFGLGSTRTLLGGGFIHKATFNRWTPRATIRYEIAQDANIYFSYSQGFKAGTFNTSASPTSPDNPPVKPEKSTNYEIGFKIARPRLRIEGAIFYTDFKDLQTSTVVQDPITHRLSTTVINAKGAENYGGELTVFYTPIDDLNIHAGVGYTHARYKKFANASVNVIDSRPLINNTTTCVAPAAPCVANPNYLIGILTNQTQDFTGLQIERAPDWSANIGIDYTAHIGGGSLVLAANGNYVSSYAPRTDTWALVNGHRKRLYLQKGYAQVNASATYNFAGDHFSLGVWVKNLTGYRFKTTFNPGANGVYDEYSMPTSFGFTAGYKF